MKCQNCGTKDATTRFTQSINGQSSEYLLCSECAEKMGIGGIFSSFGSFGTFGSLDPFAQFAHPSSAGSLFGSLFGSMFGMPAPARSRSVTTCSKCGSTLAAIRERGTVGCADCYTVFSEQLMPTIDRIHKRTQHVGKLPPSVGRNTTAASAAQPAAKQPAASPTAPKTTQTAPKQAAAAPAPDKTAQIAALRQQLQQAVAKEEYELAAQLRDRIKVLEGK